MEVPSVECFADGGVYGCVSGGSFIPALVEFFPGSESVGFPEFAAILPGRQATKFAPPNDLTKEPFRLRKCVGAVVMFRFVEPFFHSFYQMRNIQETIVQTMREVAVIQKKRFGIGWLTHGILERTEPH
jgi:hypothetical protein